MSNASSRVILSSLPLPVSLALSEKATIHICYYLNNVANNKPNTTFLPLQDNGCASLLPLQSEQLVFIAAVFSIRTDPYLSFPLLDSSPSTPLGNDCQPPWLEAVDVKKFNPQVET